MLISKTKSDSCLPLYFRSAVLLIAVVVMIVNFDARQDKVLPEKKKI